MVKGKKLLDRQWAFNVINFLAPGFIQEAVLAAEKARMPKKVKTKNPKPLVISKEFREAMLTNTHTFQVRLKHMLILFRTETWPRHVTDDDRFGEEKKARYSQGIRLV